MEIIWAEATFKLTTHKEKKDALILSDVDDLTTRVDDAVVTMGNVLASPHIGPIRTEAEEFGGKLNVLQVNQRRVRRIYRKCRRLTTLGRQGNRCELANKARRAQNLSWRDYCRLLPGQYVGEGIHR